MSRVSYLFRSLFLIGFIVAMPILALPSVARRLDDYLYGHEKMPLLPETITPLAEAPAGDGIAQATFEVPVVDSRLSRTDAEEPKGLDAADVQPPPLAELPEFPESHGPTGVPSPKLDLEFDPEEFNSRRPQRSGFLVPIELDEAAEARVSLVRRRLEDLGADYILLDADDAGQFQFHCRMLLTAGGEETKSFEAEGTDAAAVAEQVLKTVEEWRGSQISPGR